MPTSTPTQPTAIDPQIKNLVSAIGQQETGASSDAAYTQKGASGEYGRYQFMPDTWKAWAGTHLGDANAPMTMENQNKVAYAQVKAWKDQGLNPAQIAAAWNAGEGSLKNDAWKTNVGTNAEGVKYDTPTYVRNVSKYYEAGKATIQTPSTTVNNPPQSMGNRFMQFGKDFARGAAMSVPQTIQDVGSTARNIGLGLEKGVGAVVGAIPGVNVSPQATSGAGGDIFDKSQGIGKSFAKSMETPGIGGAVGGAVGNIMQLGIGAGTEKGVQLGEKGIDIAKSAVLNSDEAKTLAKIADPEAKKFISGKTFQEVADSTQKAIDSFVSTSKAELQSVKQTIPNIAVSADRKILAIKDAIVKSVQNTADYKGVTGDVNTLFKTVEDVKDSGLLTEEEIKRVNGMEKAVSSWTDNSARGMLNLKEKLGAFYKDGLTGSNRILGQVSNNLKDIVGEVAPDIKPALEKASQNIDKAEEFTKNLVGKTDAAAETKLMQIAKNLKNPALKGYQNQLLSELKVLTGYDALPELQGYANYAELLAKNFPSKFGTVMKGVATSPAAKVVGGIVAGGLSVQGLKDLGL